MKNLLLLLAISVSWVNHAQVMSLNGTALTAAGGAPSNCTAGGYKTLNSAAISGSCVTFTTGSFQNGAIWACDGINLNQSFKLTFTINFGTNTSSGDGMAFLLQTEGVPQVIGGRGGGLGYAQGDGGGCQGAAGGCPITPSVAVEFDTYDNSPAAAGSLNDIAADHTSIQTNGIMTSGNTLSGPISLLTSGATVKDGAAHNVCITWDPTLNRYTVFFDGVQRMQYNGNIRTLFADPTNVYWGFTGASGGAAQTQSICSAAMLTNIASPSCSCTAPVATATPNPQTICSGNATGVTLSSTIVGTTYSWQATSNTSVGGESTTAQSGATITDVLSNSTTTSQIVNYTVTPTASGCVGTAITVPVTVNPLPVMTSATALTKCSGASVGLALTSNPTATSYSWIATANANVGGESTTAQSSSTISDVLTNTTTTAQTVTYTVTPTLNGCAGTPQTVTVTINPIPAMTSPTTGSVCSGTALNFGLTANVAGSTFSWVATDNANVTGESLTAQSTATINNTLVNTSSTAQTVTYTVTPTASTCVGAAQTVTITVNPLPVMTSATALTKCSGASVGLALTSTPTATSYTWLATANANVGGESTTAQSSSTISDVLTNTTTTAQTVTYTVTPTLNGCAGTPQTVTVTINPIPAMTSPTSGSVCSGTALNFGLTANVAGSTFSWVATDNANVTGESLTAQSTATINNTLVNTSSTAQTVTYTVTPTALTCVGAAQTVTITVNPLPLMTSGTTTTICSGSSVGLALTSNPTATSYSWVATSNLNVGGESTTAQSSSTISDVLTNSTTTSQTVTYSVTPALNGCTGSPQTVTVTVNPLPVMTSATALTKCSGATVGLTLTSTPTATSYSWIATANANVGGESTTAQSSSTISDVLTNTTTTAQTVTYTVTPTLNGCAGTPQTVTVTVNLLPVMTSPTTGSVCSGTALNFGLTANVAGSTFSWVATDNTNVTGESLTAQSTTIINNTLVNTTTTTQTVTYTITPTASTCVGTTQTVTITVNPLSLMTSGTTATICSGASVGLALTSNPTATSYSWVATSNANVGGESTTAQSSSTISDVLTNSTVSAQSVIYSVTPTLNGCAGTPQTVTATVNPLPVMTSQTTGSVCSGTALNFGLTANVGSTFSWLATDNANVTGESLTAQSTVTINNTLVNTSSTAQTVTYTVTPTLNGCVGTAQTVTITVNPLPLMTSGTTTIICSGVSVGLALTSNPAATSYSWVATANVNVGGESTTAQSSSTISDVLTNTTTTAQTVTYTVTPTLNGCVGSPQTVTVSVNPIPSTPTITTAPATCLANGSASISNYDPTAAYVFSPVGPTAGSTITGMTPGTNYTLTASNGSCSSVLSTSFSIAAQLTQPSIPTITTTVATCLANGTATITNYSGTLTYTFSPMGPTAGSTITGMTPGTSYTLIASNGSCSSSVSNSFSIDAQLIVPSTPTITTAAASCLANGSASISNYDPTATYVFSPVGPTAGATITGMTPGTNYTLTASNGSCTSALSTSFSIAAQLTQPSIPTITTTVATCLANGTATITNYSGTLTYTFSPTGPTAGSTITGMTPGTSYTLTASNGSCFSPASASFSISAQLTVPSTPTITTAAATCLANGSVSISNYDPTATYVFSPVGPTAGSTITGMIPGTNYTLTASNGSCTSALSTSFSIAAQLTQPSIPTITTTAATCLANGTATITNYSGTLTYTFSPTGPTAGSTITGMTPGTSYTLIASNGSCSSSVSNSFSIDAQLIVPSTPTITTAAATCLANGSASISNYDPTATYVFSPVGPTAGATITGMTPGTSYTLTASNGSCTSALSTSFNIAAQLTQPSTPIITTTAATCLANGTATITNYSGTLTYTFSPTGPTAGSTITGMSPGTSYTLTASNGSCSSSVSNSFSIDAQLTVPSTPAITTAAATCLANGSASISNYDPTTTYVFSPVGPTAGATITGMTPGTNYTVTASNGSCTSALSTSFNIAAQLTQPSTPIITTTAATCLANGTATITNYSGTLTYTFSPTGPTAGSTITGMSPGTSYTLTASNGSCSSSVSNSFSIDAQLTVPSTPAITTAAATCLANGSASISNYDPTTTYVFSPVGPTAGATITGMTPGTNYTVTASNGSCTSAISTSFSIAAQLTQPSTPTISTSSATCSANGTATITNYSGTLTYTFSPTGPTAGSTISGMTPGTSYTLTASNGSCSSAISNSFSIDAQLSTPVISISATDPSLCNLNDGSILVTGSGTGTLNWSGSANGTANSATLNYTISSLGAGNYSIYFVDGTTGCQSTTLTTTLINPGAPIINNPGDQTYCDSYILPLITGTTLSGNQAYYSNSQSNGGTMISGPITSTQTVYIYDANGTCSDEESFVVTINNTPVITNPGSQAACISYSLPSIAGSNLSGSQAYYTNSQANGGIMISGSISSNQTVYMYDANGSCSDEESFVVTINSEPSLVSFTGGSTYCQGDLIADLIATVNGSADYSLYYSINGVTQTPITISTSNFNLGSVAGIYVLDSLADANCLNNSLSATQTITINPIPVAPTAGTDTTYCSNATPNNMIASGTGTFTWYDNNNNVLGTGPTYTPSMNIGITTYNVSQTANGCEGPTASVLITVEECGIIVPTAFTPDNDNANDVWILNKIDQIYPNNIVTIFNRWGNQIFQSKAGQYEFAPWDGTFNNEKLPVGSYYYVIEYNDNFTEKSNGIVTIIK